MATIRWDETEIIPALKEAGTRALAHFLDTEISVKHDATLVTKADVEIESMLEERLAKLRPEAYFIGEETEQNVAGAEVEAALESEAWIVDPVDGTASFAHGFGMWGISIGYSSKGILVDGAILLPATGELVITSGDDVLYGREGDRPDEWRFDSLQRIEKPEPQRHGGGIITVSQDVAKRGIYRGASAVHAAGSCVYSVVNLIKGGYVGYVGNAKLWDIAGGIALLTRLGFTILLASGAPVTDTIRPELYNLVEGARRKWRLREHFFVAPDPAACETLIAELTLPGKLPG